MTKIKDEHLVQIHEEDRIVEWDFDPDVVGDKSSSDGSLRQPQFLEQISLAKIKYKTVFDHLDQLVKYKKVGVKEITYLQWADINKQYHVSHEMLGINASGHGGQRCLFSNLLAVVMSDKEHVTEKNALLLRRAMARYLVKLQVAQTKWAYLKDQKPTDKKLEEEAKLAKVFEQAIYKTHKCSVLAYQKWLRNEKGGAKVELDDLTPFEIQLCAYTLGIKIGVLPIMFNCKSEVDQYGRIVPVGTFYGPNTKEFFLMGCNGGIDNEKKEDLPGTYYGLFPKLNVLKNVKLNELYVDEIKAIQDIETYWYMMDMNVKK
jgi:hypothetical protein